jgi:hypothetical protein
MQKENEIQVKSKLRIDINRSLLSVCFSLFVFIIAINSKILQNNIIVASELTIAIPILLSSIFARSKLAYTQRTEMWNNFGYITFTIGYAFLINVVGILLSSLVTLYVGLLFFGLNILMSLIYSTFEIIEDKSRLSSRFYKDLFFILLIIIFGILPSIGVY